jgi:putative restriction endonuclease
MSGRAWTRDEIILAMNLYCQLPFGRLHARNPDIIRLAGALDRTPSSVAMKLCNLASLDPAHHERGIKGLSKVSAGDRQVWDEFHSDWNRLAAESEQLRSDRIERDVETYTSVASESADVQPAEYIGETEGMREVRIRLAQRFFRRSVLASYDYRCCVTEIGIKPLLIASHILPWSRFPAHRADPRNGLCLSRLHDAAFDRGLIAFDAEHRLVVSRELCEATTNRVLNEAFLRYKGEPLLLPEKFQPDSSFLQRHYAEVFRG